MLQKLDENSDLVFKLEVKQLFKLWSVDIWWRG